MPGAMPPGAPIPMPMPIAGATSPAGPAAGGVNESGKQPINFTLEGNPKTSVDALGEFDRILTNRVTQVVNQKRQANGGQNGGVGPGGVPMPGAVGPGAAPPAAAGAIPPAAGVAPPAAGAAPPAAAAPVGAVPPAAAGAAAGMPPGAAPTPARPK